MSTAAASGGGGPNGLADDVDGYRMPLLEHLEELRKRMIRGMIAYAVALGVCLLFSKQLFHFLILPALPYFPEGSTFIYTKLPEAFLTYLKVSLLASVFVASPILFYEGWRFVAPGLYAKERKLVVPFVLFSTALFVAGAAACYFAVLPWACKFFLGYGNETTAPMLTIGEYLSFSTRLLLAFGVVFELPLAMMFLGRIGFVRTPLLRKARPFALIGVFVLASLITPPDVVTQIALGLPLMVLYELGIVLVKWVEPAEDDPTHDED
jgi:sec-independent protein translocase protein TatC